MLAYLDIGDCRAQRASKTQRGNSEQNLSLSTSRRCSASSILMIFMKFFVRNPGLLERRQSNSYLNQGKIYCALENVPSNPPLWHSNINTRSLRRMICCDAGMPPEDDQKSNLTAFQWQALSSLIHEVPLLGRLIGWFSSGYLSMKHRHDILQNSLIFLPLPPDRFCADISITAPITSTSRLSSPVYRLLYGATMEAWGECADSSTIPARKGRMRNFRHQRTISIHVPCMCATTIFHILHSLNHPGVSSGMTEMRTQV